MKIEKGKREEGKGKQGRATNWYTYNAHLALLHQPARTVMRYNGPEFLPKRAKFHER